MKAKGIRKAALIEVKIRVASAQTQEGRETKSEVKKEMRHERPHRRGGEFTPGDSTMMRERLKCEKGDSTMRKNCEECQKCDKHKGKGDGKHRKDGKRPRGERPQGHRPVNLTTEAAGSN